jgi:hypothetical protein
MSRLSAPKSVSLHAPLKTKYHLIAEKQKEEIKPKSALAELASERALARERSESPQKSDKPVRSPTRGLRQEIAVIGQQAGQEKSSAPLRNPIISHSITDDPARWKNPIFDGPGDHPSVMTDRLALFSYIIYLSLSLLTHFSNNRDNESRPGSPGALSIIHSYNLQIAQAVDSSNSSRPVPLLKRSLNLRANEPITHSALLADFVEVR